MKLQGLGMNGKVLTKQELLRFKLKAYLQGEANKKAIAEREKQRFEEKAAELFSHISKIFADEPGIQVNVTEPFLQEVAANVGDLELDIVGKKVEISPALKDGAIVLEVEGLVQESLHLELNDGYEWRVRKSSSYSWIRLDDDFWFTHLADLVPK